MNSPAARFAIEGSKRNPVPRARFLRLSDPNEVIRISLYTRRNPAGAVDVTRAKGLSGQSPHDRRYLKGDAFEKAFGAAPADFQLVETWARQHDLRIVDQSLAQRRIRLEGTIANVSGAFQTELKEFEHEDRGHFRGREGALYVPEPLFGIVEGVFGLDTRPVGHSRRRHSHYPAAPFASFERTSQETRGAARAVPAVPWPGTFFPPDVARLYNYPDGLDGTGQNIAIFAFNGTDPDPRGGYSPTALQTYFEQVLGGKTPAITNVVVQGPGNDPGPDTQASDNRGDTTGEVMLDMCVVGSIAPGANIFMYFTEFTTQGWVDAIHEAIAGANDISVISISYGNPEDDPQGLWTRMGVKMVSEAFEAAQAKGITICCASGDDGSGDGEATGVHVDFPASSPAVLGVGGTKLVAADSSNSTIRLETVWNETTLQEGATGGGFSVVFGRPPYQANIAAATPSTTAARLGRGVPDVAAVGDPETGVVVMHVDGTKLEPIGGTSASTPIWAALVARLNQSLGTRVGFFNELLYTKLGPGVLNDIIEGNNGAYAAAIGWDPCSGFGSPNGTRLLAALGSVSSR